MANDLCSSRQCNVCLLLKTEDEKPAAGNHGSAAPTAVAQKLLKCSSCKLVLYCSKQHQKVDWPLHRNLCDAVQRVCRTYQVGHPFFIKGQPTNEKALEVATLQVKYLIGLALSRPLQYYEQELTSFPAHCAVCFAFDKLEPCLSCKGVSYCSAAHAEEDAERHQRSCSLLELYYCPYKVHSPPQDLITDFFKKVTDLHRTDLVDAFQRATQKQLPAKPAASLEAYQLFATAADFSCIGTICYALGFVEMSSYDCPQFVIFIVGASVEEELWFKKIHMKFFFLQNPQITKLELYFIGPEVAAGLEPREEVFNFQGTKRSVLYSGFRGLFQDFCQEQTIQPSLIICFNCGFSEYSHVANTDIPSINDIPTENTWPAGIVQMLQFYQRPIVFTSYTKMEADFDYAALLRQAKSNTPPIHVERFFHIKQNPYRDLRPLRNWHLIDKEPFFYRNGYVQGVRTRVKS